MSITGTQHPCGRTRRFVNKLTVALEGARRFAAVAATPAPPGFDGAGALHRGVDDFEKDAHQRVMRRAFVPRELDGAKSSTVYSSPAASDQARKVPILPIPAQSSKRGRAGPSRIPVVRSGLRPQSPTGA
jgi:hypothetical protein